ncbi:helix-turn-helix domain-containing protein [Cryptosporangium japonicum]|uniref:HTH araC/xylS-type domain-containing protein n=1 Tax=Cryptosporangium japonicum TaxID=80872 RepID=A0ABP3ELJ6_9ACTN
MPVQLHSALAERAAGRCSGAVAAAAPWLRPYVVGYGGYRVLGGPPVRRRLFPVTLTTLLLDADEGARLVTGARRDGAVHDGRPWRSGVSVGLTPAGVRALLDVEAAAVAGGTFALDGRLGRLSDRLAELPDWPARVAALDAVLTTRLRGRTVERLVDRAWWRLQDPAGTPVGSLAPELGVSRRHLELEFRRRIGLTPKTVARVARLQRAVGVLTAPTATLGDAAAVGFADQSHLSRETRALLGSTPGELFAFVQDALRPAH